MKTIFSKSLLAVCAIVTIVAIACVKDTGTQSYKVFKPITASMASLRASIKTEAAKPIKNAGKMFVLGNFVFVNEKNEGIHVIDNTNPSSPINKTFINIPGNLDVAVKDNILYADCYNDVVAINISNPNNIVITTVVEDVFKDKRFLFGRTLPVGTALIGWESKDTTVDIEVQPGLGIWTKNESAIIGPSSWFIGLGGGLMSMSPSGATSPVNGIAGSNSRFAIQNNYMYCVTKSELHIFNINNASTPTTTNIKNIGWEIETIYPFKDKLFIGARSGMFIYDIANPTNPNYVSGFSHARLCDPVIADDTHAYLTLHASNNICDGTQNELNVLDITDITRPTLLTRVNLTKPQGLSKHNNILMVCDDNSGVRVFNVANPANPQLITTIPLQAAYEVILINGIALVTAKDGLYQYNYSNINNIQPLGKISFMQ
ncbi:MAG: LVIVD repeat-containing protein [Chitinophagaceae bacterium]